MWWTSSTSSRPQRHRRGQVPNGASRCGATRRSVQNLFPRPRRARLLGGPERGEQLAQRVRLVRRRQRAVGRHPCYRRAVAISRGGAMKSDRSSRAKSTKLAWLLGSVRGSSRAQRLAKPGAAMVLHDLPERTSLPSYTSSSAPPRATAFFTRPPAIQCSSIPWMKSGRTHLPRATQWAASSIRRPRPRRRRRCTPRSSSASSLVR